MDPWLSPMLCAGADVVPEGPNWVLEGKIDGWRCVTHILGDGTVCLYGGRNGNAYTGRVPYIENELLSMLPPDSAVDGELIGTGLSGAMGYVQSVMTAANAHKPSARVPALTYVVFDLIRVGGEDIRSKPWVDRRLELENWIGPANHIRLSPVGESTPASHDAMLAHGLEGSVCKRRNSAYINGRSNSWVKIKPQETCEAVIVGFKDSKVGPRVGAFIIELLDENDVPTGVKTTVKCGTEARHKSATLERDYAGMPSHEFADRRTGEPPWIGAVIEIKHNGIQDSGAPRHPNFYRRRGDKTAAPAKPRTAKKERPRMAGGPTNRNYGAMGDTKLLKCIDELANGGDARNRVENKGGDVNADLEIALNAARSRDLDVPLDVLAKIVNDSTPEA